MDTSLARGVAMFAAVLVVVVVVWAFLSKVDKSRSSKPPMLSWSVATFFGQCFGTDAGSLEKILLELLEKGIARESPSEDVSTWKDVLEARAEKLGPAAGADIMRAELRSQVATRRKVQPKSPKRVLPADVAEVLLKYEGTRAIIGKICERQYGDDWDTSNGGMFAAIVSRFPKPEIGAHTEDFTQMAASGMFPNFFPGTLEGVAEKLVRVLTKSNHPFAVVIGQPGVGKTALLQFFAVKLVSGRYKDEGLPPDTPMFVASYRGILAEADEGKVGVEAVFSEMFSTLPEGSVLVIDEAVELFKDAAFSEIVKPLDKLRVVLVTTTGEFNTVANYLDKNDPALRRRFVTIEVEPPTNEETIKILEERFKEYALSPRVLKVAARLGGLRLAASGEGNPSAAIAAVSLALTSPGARGGKIGPDHVCEAMHDLSAGVHLTRISNLVGEFLRDGEFRYDITPESVREVMRNGVIGQSHVIDAVVARLQGYLNGDAPEAGPAGVWFFAGPTGVGKTEMAKAIARALRVGEDEIVFLHGETFTEDTSVSRLVGSSPGYVGYEDVALLGKPCRILFVDEFEKMSPDVMKLFLGILQEGSVTLANGRIVNLRGTFVILTSNVGAKRIQEYVRSGEEVSLKGISRIVIEELRESPDILPELVGRLSMGAILPFFTLSLADVEEIVGRLVRKRNEDWKGTGMSVRFANSATGFIAREVLGSGEFGARPAIGAVNVVCSAVAGLYGRTFTRGGSSVVLSVSGGKLYARQGSIRQEIL